MRSFVGILILTCLAAGAFAQENAPTPTPTPTPESAEAPKREIPPDFKSDNCSLFPDGNYKDCCVAHDLDYYYGGSCKERAESDKRLYRCVKNKKGWYNKFVAPIMWVGVRIGGVSFLPTPFRWGFGRNKEKKRKREEQQKKEEERKKQETEKKKADNKVDKPKEKDTEKSKQEDMDGLESNATQSAPEKVSVEELSEVGGGEEEVLHQSPELPETKKTPITETTSENE